MKVLRGHLASSGVGPKDVDTVIGHSDLVGLFGEEAAKTSHRVRLYDVAGSRPRGPEAAPCLTNQHWGPWERVLT